MVTENELTQGIRSIEQNLTKLNDLKNKLKDAVKDEHDAQEFYSGIINMAQGIKLRDDISSRVRSIKNDEAIHEMAFKGFVQNMNEVEQNMKNEIERLKRDLDKLRKSQVKDPNRRYGR